MDQRLFSESRSDMCPRLEPVSTIAESAESLDDSSTLLELEVSAGLPSAVSDRTASQNSTGSNPNADLSSGSSQMGMSKSAISKSGRQFKSVLVG